VEAGDLNTIILSGWDIQTIEKNDDKNLSKYLSSERTFNMLLNMHSIPSISRIDRK
jgi:hypothetical protein